MRTGFTAVLTMTAALATACTTTGPVDSEPDLFGEYLMTVNVKNDPLAAVSVDIRDGVLASEGVDAMETRDFVMSPIPCDPYPKFRDAFKCRPTDAMLAEAESNYTMLWSRYILAKHPDDSFEFIKVYVVDDHPATAKVMDETGSSYSGDLSDFVQNNKILSSGDVILAPERPADPDSRLVTVYGATTVEWFPTILCGLAIVLPIGGLIAFLNYRFRRKTSER
jgi:hypothetical protein